MAGAAGDTQSTSMPVQLETLGAGALFGAGAGALLLLHGRIAGISGIAAQALETAGSERAWRLWFLAGLLAGGAWVGWRASASIAFEHVVRTPWLLLAGLAIGVGARVGNGCTSGHGVCGVGRLSRRSMAAVVTFSASGALVYRLIAACGGLS